MSKVTRGLFFLGASSFIAIVIGYIINIALGRLLQPEGYGIFNTVISLVSIVGVFATAGIQFAVSKYVSEAEERGDSAEKKGILRKGLMIQLIWVTPIFLLFILFPDVIAGWIGDTKLSPFINISAWLILLTSVFSIFDNYLNGIRAFGRQTVAGVVFNLGKLMSVLLVLFGLGVAGAVGGYVFSALLGLIVIITFYVITSRRDKLRLKEVKSVPSQKIISYALPMVAFLIFFTILQNLDILAVKSILKSDQLTGFYGAAAMISRVPFFFLGAISIVLFPTLSGSISAKKTQDTNKYISNAVRYLLILLTPIALIIALTSNELVTLIYSETYLAAGEPLSILFFGMTSVLFLQLFATIVNAEGRPMLTAGVAALSVLISGILNFILNPTMGITGAAIATTLAGLTGTILLGSYVHKKYNINLKKETILRILAGLVVVLITWAGIETWIEWKGVLLLIEYGMLYSVYWIFLIGSREIGKTDLKIGMKIIPKVFAQTILRILKRE